MPGMQYWWNIQNIERWHPHSVPQTINPGGAKVGMQVICN